MIQLFRKLKISKEREIILLNKIPLLQYTKSSKGKSFSRVKIFPRSHMCQIYDELLELTHKKHDLIIIIRAGLGEAYLLNYFLDSLINKYKSTSPCLVGYSSFLGDMFKMYHPDIPYYVHKINRTILSESIFQRVRKYRGTFFCVNPSTLSELQQLLSSYETGKGIKHYAVAIKDFNGVNSFAPQKALIESKLIKNVFVKTHGLPDRKFVFLNKEAHFVYPISSEFWDKLIALLRTKNYEIYENTNSLSIPEAVFLASKSRGIISIRGGFSEVLSTLSVPKYVLYTQCRFHNFKNIKDIFTLTKYPFVDQSSIFEYELSSNNSEEIISKILERF